MLRSYRTAAVLFASTATVACGREVPRLSRTSTPAVTAAGDAAGCDSALAARVALDSLGRLDPFRSAVLRFQRDTAGFRIVTSPADSGSRTDGMAVVRVGRDCRVVALVQTDSA
jgi:hypothetical protein